MAPIVAMVNWEPALFHFFVIYSLSPTGPAKSLQDAAGR